MSSPGLAKVNSQDQPLYWTDDIPVCYLSAVGLSNNQIYRDNAPTRQEEHECEDSSFRFRPESDNDIFLYGVFDGHEGSKLSNFAAQRFPAEILLGQLGNKLDDEEEVLNVLHQAFGSVDKAYLDTISDLLAERCNLREQLEGVTSQEAYQNYNDVMNKLENIEQEIAGGSSAVLALVIKNKLYVAYVGCCRALLCKTDPDGVLRVHQLTMDHDLRNEEELQRLADLGLNVEQLRVAGHIGRQPYTRTIGDFNVKIGYKDIEMLRTASSEPVIAEPETSNAIELDDSCRFLILMSSGVYRNLEAAGTQNVNVSMASAVASEFAVNSTLSGVAQGVIDKVARIHHDAYVTNSDGKRREICQKRDDMTLLVRNFNYPMPNAVSSPVSTGSPIKPLNVQNFVGQNFRHTTPLSVMIPSGNDNTQEGDHRPMFTVGTFTNLTNTFDSTHRSTTYTSSNDSTQSGEESGTLFAKKSTYKNPLPLDDEGKIEAYVSFDGLLDCIDNLTDEDKEKFYAQAEPRPAYEPIPEEREMLSPSASSPQSLTEIDTTTS